MGGPGDPAWSAPMEAPAACARLRQSTNATGPGSMAPEWQRLRRRLRPTPWSGSGDLMGRLRRPHGAAPPTPWSGSADPTGFGDPTGCGGRKSGPVGAARATPGRHLGGPGGPMSGSGGPSAGNGLALRSNDVAALACETNTHLRRPARNKRRLVSWPWLHVAAVEAASEALYDAPGHGRRGRADAAAFPGGRRRCRGARRCSDMRRGARANVARGHTRRDRLRWRCAV